MNEYECVTFISDTLVKAAASQAVSDANGKIEKCAYDIFITDKMIENINAMACNNDSSSDEDHTAINTLLSDIWASRFSVFDGLYKSAYEFSYNKEVDRLSKAGIDPVPYGDVIKGNAFVMPSPRKKTSKKKSLAETSKAIEPVDNSEDPIDDEPEVKTPKTPIPAKKVKEKVVKEKAPKVRNGTLLEKALEIYKQEVNPTRKVMMHMFIDKLGMKPNSASTYFYFCKDRAG
jgi:hypothetical protein